MKEITIKSHNFSILCEKPDDKCNGVEITLKNNPYAYIKDVPSKFYAVKQDNTVVGSIYIYPIIVTADKKEYIANCASTLYVSKEERGKGIGKELAICRMNASPDRISIGAGLSNMSYPLYKKLGCTFFYSKRMGLIVKSGKILKGYIGWLSVILGPIMNFFMSLLAFSLHFKNLKLRNKYVVSKLNEATAEIEEIVKEDKSRFQEKHTKEWFNWLLNYNFLTHESDKNYLYTIRNKQGFIEAFFMFKKRIKDDITSKHINNVCVISLIEWGIKRNSSLTEKDIVACFSKEARKLEADIVEVSFLANDFMKSLKRSGFINMMDARIVLYAGDSSPLRNHSGWNEGKNWRLRPAYSDYGFC